MSVLAGAYASGALVSNTKQLAHTRINEDLCGTVLTSKVIKMTERMIKDGTWDIARLRGLDQRGIGTQFVKVTIHIVRFSNGTGGIPESRIATAISDLNFHVASTNLVFFQHGDIIYFDSDQYAVCTTQEATDLKQIDPVDGTVNIWLVPDLVNSCGTSSFPFSSVQGIVIDNDCTATSGNHSTFSHEVGHYFHLFHTHETFLGDECVDGSNCTNAGDLICDTPADPRLSGVVNNQCQYTGTELDACGSGDPYVPATDNMMSYSLKSCRVVFTQEQLSMILWSAENERADHLAIASTGACCIGDNGDCVQIFEFQCNNGGGNWNGLGATCAQTICGQVPCDGDVNANGVVDVGDLLMVIDQWGKTVSPADINGDGIVDVTDLLIVVGNWGPCP